MARANCPQCGGTGWKTVAGPDGSSVAVLCECTSTDREARLLARARIPKRYEHCDFDNYETDLYGAENSGWDRSMAQAKLLVEGFAREYSAETEIGLLLMGPCGVGKTHLGVAALKDLARRGHDGIFYDYRELLKEIQSSYNPVNQTTEMDVLAPVLTAPLLVLDDIGSSKPSAWALETVGHILNTRYNEKRVTLITSNYLDADSAAGPRPAGPRVHTLPTGQAVSGSEESLADRVGQRIRSRLYEMCRTVEITAPDYRREARHAGLH